ncbi:hypothetical protein ES705_39523 [subsurface metagenome]
MLCGILDIVIIWNDIPYSGTFIKGNKFHEFNREIYTNFKLS